MMEVVVTFKSWDLMFHNPCLLLNMTVIAELGCDLIASIVLDPVGYEFIKVLLLECDGEAHLNIIRAVLVELIDPDAPV